MPSFVMEVGAWREDEGRKAELYERLGVQEYCDSDTGCVSRAGREQPVVGWTGPSSQRNAPSNSG